MNVIKHCENNSFNVYYNRLTKVEKFNSQAKFLGATDGARIFYLFTFYFNTFSAE